MTEKKERKVKLSDIKEHISCYLCKNYLNEATTIIECLHTFCKDCIVKHLNENNNCPKCDLTVHQSHPLQYISFDRTMQDIVCKVVPQLNNSNTNNNNNKTINNNNNLSNKTSNDAGSKQADVKPTGDKLKTMDTNCQNYHRLDEQICLIINPDPSSDLKSLKDKYLRLSSLATITILKKYIAIKIFNEEDRYKELDLFCNGNLQGKDHSLKFVAVTQWRDKVPPIELTYSRSESANPY